MDHRFNLLAGSEFLHGQLIVLSISGEICDYWLNIPDMTYKMCLKTPNKQSFSIWVVVLQTLEGFIKYLPGHAQGLKSRFLFKVKKFHRTNVYLDFLDKKIMTVSNKSQHSEYQTCQKSLVGKKDCITPCIKIIFLN